jgi:hypothetical protein
MPQYVVLQGQTAHIIQTEMNKNAQAYELFSFSVAASGQLFVALMKLK